MPEPTFLIDLGGTWLRSRANDERGETTRTRSPSLLNFPGSPVTVLRQRLVDELTGLAPPGAVVAMSLGAALDEERGIVYGSAPLWGENRDVFDLLSGLRTRRADVAWHLYNDVTAALADFGAANAGPTTRQVGYLTISSGVAYRQMDWASRTVTVDEWGLHGEIGHSIAQLPEPLRPPTLPRCDCGRVGHVGAVSSGPGIERIARMFGIGPARDFDAAYRRALTEGDTSARKVLRTAVAPIAEFIRGLWSLTPHLDLLGLGGGVVENLSGWYRDELFRQLGEQRSYADRGRDLDWLAAHVLVCEPRQVDTMRGAALLQRGEVAIAR